MEASEIRNLICDKLKDGRLPYDSMPRFWGGPGNGERCAACDMIVTKEQLVMEGVTATASGDSKSIWFHLSCFNLWEQEKRQARSS